MRHLIHIGGLPCLVGNTTFADVISETLSPGTKFSDTYSPSLTLFQSLASSLLSSRQWTHPYCPASLRAHRSMSFLSLPKLVSGFRRPSSPPSRRLMSTQDLSPGLTSAAVDQTSYNDLHRTHCGQMSWPHLQIPSLPSQTFLSHYLISIGGSAHRTYYDNL